jgi:hypothetical protein
MGLLKGECNSKRAGKGLLKIFVPQRKGKFFGKELLPKCAKKPCREERRKKNYLGKLMPIIYIKGSFYETPLYGHVRRDKQDSDNHWDLHFVPPLPSSSSHHSSRFSYSMFN